MATVVILAAGSLLPASSGVRAQPERRVYDTGAIGGLGMRIPRALELSGVTFDAPTGAARSDGRGNISRSDQSLRLGSSVGTHTVKSGSSATITISRADFSQALSTTDPVRLAQFGARIPREFAHALLAGGSPSTAGIPSPTRYLTAGMHGEAVAFTAKYLIGRKLGIPSSMTQGMGTVLATLDGYFHGIGACDGG